MQSSHASYTNFQYWSPKLTYPEQQLINFTEAKLNWLYAQLEKQIACTEQTSILTEVNSAHEDWSKAAVLKMSATELVYINSVCLHHPYTLQQLTDKQLFFCAGVW